MGNQQAVVGSILDSVSNVFGAGGGPEEFTPATTLPNYRTQMFPRYISVAACWEKQASSERGERKNRHTGELETDLVIPIKMDREGAQIHAACSDCEASNH